jgi:hypothetical protein
MLSNRDRGIIVQLLSTVIHDSSGGQAPLQRSSPCVHRSITLPIHSCNNAVTALLFAAAGLATVSQLPLVRGLQDAPETARAGITQA